MLSSHTDSAELIPAREDSLVEYPAVCLSFAYLPTCGNGWNSAVQGGPCCRTAWRGTPRGPGRARQPGVTRCLCLAVTCPSPVCGGVLWGRCRSQPCLRVLTNCRTRFRGRRSVTHRAVASVSSKKGKKIYKPTAYLSWKHECFPASRPQESLGQL